MGGNRLLSPGAIAILLGGVWDVPQPPLLSRAIRCCLPVSSSANSHLSAGITALALCCISITGKGQRVCSNINKNNWRTCCAPGLPCNIPSLGRSEGLAQILVRVWNNGSVSAINAFCTALFLILPSKLIYYYIFSWAVHQSVLMMKGMLYTHLITAHVFV